jgi:hypothetical protein
MKWKTHTAIARAISKSLDLPKDLEKALSQGSIEPDKYPDTSASHHDPELEVIMKHIWNARLAYLSGDNFQAMKSLGRALHYIQDKSVSKGFFGLSHDSREDDISYQTIPENAIERGIYIAICSPHYVKKCIKNVKPKKNLDEIMNQACMYSAAIAKAVIGDKTPSNELVENFKSAKERYRKRTIPVAIGTFGVISIASIIMQNFLYIIFGILAGYIIQRLDLKYHYLKEETKWFGIK